MLRSKVLEEARKLTEATNRAETIHEAADLIYFTLVSLISSGVTLAEVESALDTRELRITRRAGNVKEQNIERR